MLNTIPHVTLNRILSPYRRGRLGLSKTNTMAPPIILALLLLLLIPALSLSLAIHPTFTHPPISSRPKFRYWFPDASISPSVVQSDIAALASISAGGLQFLGFYNQGFPPISTNWSTYGFGTPAYKSLLRAALQTAAQHNLTFDIALGPNTAHGVPAVPRTEGLAMELVYGLKFLNASSQTRAGRIPQPVLEFNHDPLNGWVHEPENWGPSEHVATVVAKVRARNRRTGGRRPTEQIVIDKESVVDVTNLTTTAGELEWTTPALGAGESRNLNWVVVSFYQRYSNERSCVSVPGAPNWVGNGSWMVDHFSAAGAKKMASFWDENVFDDKEVDGLMRRVGKYCEFAFACWGFCDERLTDAYSLGGQFGDDGNALVDTGPCQQIRKGQGVQSRQVPACLFSGKEPLERVW